jgi:hypothetical protein
MENYTVYFEIFGKKLKTTILAESEEKAKQEIFNKIIFYKIEKDDKNNDIFNNIMNILGCKKK